jgi:hypothetical protein
VRDLLERQGFTVRGEVRGCDVVAQRGDDLVIVELKRHFGLDLLLQAVTRQRACESVYVALPAAAVAAAGRRWARQRQLLRRLELGLLLVHFPKSPAVRADKKAAQAEESRRDARTTMRAPAGPAAFVGGAPRLQPSADDQPARQAKEPLPHVEVALHPIESRRQLRRRGRHAIIQEIADRSGDHQPGGSTRTKILTAYREAAIAIAVCLERDGPASPRALRAQGCTPRTTSILSANHYGWFQRVERGVYALTEAGRAALAGPYAEAARRTKCEDRRVKSEKLRSDQLPVTSAE